MIIRFGSYEVDPDARHLRRDGERVDLEPQAFDLLVALLERRDRVVPHHELLTAVWGHTFVSPSALTTRIKEVRRAVGDDGTAQHTVANVRGRGYRFVRPTETVPVTRAAGAARHRPGIVGRDHELESLVGRLSDDDAPLVTLVGPGGVGKSTLARAVASSASIHRSDGFLVVELASVGSVDVARAVARVLDVAVDEAHPSQLARAAAAFDGVLVIDNCEHVVDEVAELVSSIVGRPSPSVRLVCTSRVRLGLAEEIVHAVEPLTIDDAVELFAARAAAVPGGTVQPDDQRVRAIVDQVDRLPLAIEMAAGRLASMTLDELAEAVAAGAILQLTHRTPTRRHRDLRSLVEWSAALLDDSERETFASFSVFAHAVPAELAASVLGDGDTASARARLSALAEKSLISADRSGVTTSLSMLQTVRLVARRWAEQNPVRRAHVEARHANDVANAAAEIDRAVRTIDEVRARRRLAQLVPELRAAHDWARLHDPELAGRLSGWLHQPAYWSFWSDPARWSSLLVEHGDRPDGEFGGAWLAMAGWAATRGDLGAARSYADRARCDGDQAREAAADEVASDVAIYAGELDLASTLAERLTTAADELGDPHVRAVAAVNGSLARAYGGSPRDALDIVGRVDRTGMSPSNLAWLEYARGEALCFAGDADAIEALQGAIDIAGSVPNPMVRWVALQSLAGAHAEMGDDLRALRSYSECLRATVRHGNLVHVVSTLRGAAAALWRSGDERGAVVLAAATDHPAQRRSNDGADERLRDVTSGAARAFGAAQVAEWRRTGEAMSLEDAVTSAIAMVELLLGTGVR